MEFTIRAASADEWAEARDLRVAMLRESPRAFGDHLDDVLAWDEQRWRVRSSSMAMHDSAWFVAVDTGGNWCGQMAGREYNGEAWLIEVYLLPAMRGTGAAGLLLARVEDWARSRGHDRLLLEVNERQAAAVAFYTRSGFTPTGDTAAHPLYPDDRELAMVKRLRPDGIDDRLPTDATLG